MDTKDILKSKRKEFNLSQKEVADYVGVSEAPFLVGNQVTLQIWVEIK